MAAALAPYMQQELHPIATHGQIPGAARVVAMHPRRLRGTGPAGSGRSRSPSSDDDDAGTRLQVKDGESGKQERQWLLRMCSQGTPRYRSTKPEVYRPEEPSGLSTDFCGRASILQSPVQRLCVVRAGHERLGRSLRLQSSPYSIAYCTHLIHAWMVGCPFVAIRTNRQTCHSSTIECRVTGATGWPRNTALYPGSAPARPAAYHSCQQAR